MNDQEISDLRSPMPRFEDLDGHTIEELSDYLDAGRTPTDPSIEASPGCRIALDALGRLRDLTPELLAFDTAGEPEPEETWVQRILSGIALDAHAGRRIPLTAPTPDVDLGITEGAVRGMIRAAEATVPGVVIGKCRFEGDVTVLGEPVRVHVEVSVPYGVPIPDIAERLRTEISARLDAHTTLSVDGIDITVRDVQQFRPAKKGIR
ncbi:Asp23/Gls24 family envelope stress response protein [Leucobacter chromiireducens]|uniref:Asp23/Gls24 family envelope stress response protein n=1 Tax=Leucobacter chromiireducens subsp. chromiireducens TaxID=660067 RepID=A0ABS1SNT7_9MICO|nr:Asp23/Gls24 family envelope stress response protein [Leucobacter chromiireducens]MBL3689833.1 Asp23/Gls24 family envelope stress response protein [Leucobacter chromiireducens subsp. chromiireducens]